MNSFKLWFVSVLVIICLAGGYFVYKQGAESGPGKYAKEALAAETKLILEENENLKKKKEASLKSIQESTDLLTQRDEENKALEGYYTKIAGYEAKSAQLEQELQTAKAEKARLSQYASELDNISNRESGAARTLEPGTYLCPDEIAAGRYKLSGTGLFRVVANASNNVTETQNLRTLESNSYTLNLEAGTKLITEGDITLTQVN